MKPPAEKLRTAKLYYHTLRHLRPWQVAGRLYAGATRLLRMTRLPDPPSSLHRQGLPAIPFLHHDPWNDRDQILDGRFRFLGQTRSLGWPVDWSGHDAPLLWRFNLHYFQYLSLLRADEQSQICRMWMEANPRGTLVAWHPYPTSLRIVNWLKSELGDCDILESLYQQAAFLYRNLETHVMGNHLLENARALVVAGSYFGTQGEAPRWLARGLDIYTQETPEQVLADGGFFERSPMYHALMLEGYLDVLNVLPASHPLHRELRAVATGMHDFLVSMTHPDGHIALFNDATEEIAPPTDALSRYAVAVLGCPAEERSAFPVAGYFVYRDSNMYFVIDGGDVGPEYLGAHAHADIFSFELSLNGLRMVVDTGVFEYASGAMRDFVRGTRAHNTVQVDDVDQVECWGSFRVARRSSPHNVAFEQDEAGFRFRGSFSGYSELIGDGIVHHRRAEFDRAGRRLNVVDEIEGRGEHRVVSRVHLHPDVRVSREDRVLVLRRAGAVIFVNTPDVPFVIEDGWYCPAFGVREKTCVIAFGGSTSLPVTVSYSLDLPDLDADTRRNGQLKSWHWA